MSFYFTSRRASIAPLALACLFSGAACLNAQIITTDAGTGGSSGGIGGLPDGTGGAAGDGTGAGGNGAGGENGGGGAAVIDAGSDGGNGLGGNGAGGAPADSGVDGPNGITPYAMGQLVITEIMADTNDVPDESGEWFELFNPSTTDTYNLKGCDLSDKSSHSVVVGDVLIAPRTYATMARFGTAAGGFLPTYNYHTTLGVGGVPDPNADVKFSNGGDSATVTCGITLIDSVVFTGWLFPPPPAVGAVANGKSYSLDPSHYSATDNDVEGNWCFGTTAYHTTDRGTPGAANPPCTCMNGAPADAGACM